MPRIAYISSTFPDYKKCGTGIYASYICQALAQQGHDVHVVTSAIPEIRPTFGKVTVHKIMESWNPLDLPKLVQLFQRIRPEVIHINHPTAIAAQKSKILINMLPDANRAFWKLPLLTTLHEFIHVTLMGKAKLFPLIYSSDLLTVTNQRSHEAVCKILPAPQQAKVRVVNIGSMLNESRLSENLSKNQRREAREKWGLVADDKVVGFVGFLTPPKGFHNLVTALAPLLRKNPKIKVLALSSWNMSSPVYRKKILDQIEFEKISGQVIFSGYLEDDGVWESLPAIDLCVFPFDEPVEDRSSGPLRQALFRGIPTVVYADDLGYSEFGFKHGENIWFTPMTNTNSLRTDVEKLLNDDLLRSKIADGTSDLRVQFSNDTVSNSFSRLYAEMLAK